MVRSCLLAHYTIHSTETPKERRKIVVVEEECGSHWMTTSGIGRVRHCRPYYALPTAEVYGHSSSWRHLLEYISRSCLEWIINLVISFAFPVELWEEWSVSPKFAPPNPIFTTGNDGVTTTSACHMLTLSFYMYGSPRQTWIGIKTNIEIPLKKLFYVSLFRWAVNLIMAFSMYARDRGY